MTNEATLEKLRKMKLKGMTKAFENLLSNQTIQDLTGDEMIAHLINAEWDDRYNRKLGSLIKKARFRYQASFENLDFRPVRNLDKNQMLRLLDCGWIRKKENIILTGETGVGKSYVASSLGNNACKNGFRVMYMNCMKLFTRLKYSKAEGNYSREMNQIQKQDLLILDDFGLETLDSASRLSFLEIIDDRQGRSSTIITSQLRFIR